jgi:hypothetical protein
MAKHEFGVFETDPGPEASYVLMNLKNITALQ